MTNDMKKEMYYIPPELFYFNELKAEAIKIWKETKGVTVYKDKKINAIRDMENVGDNFMRIVAMFDIFNQHKLAGRLSETTRNEVKKRLKAGGQEVNAF